MSIALQNRVDALEEMVRSLHARVEGLEGKVEIAQLVPEPDAPIVKLARETLTLEKRKSA